ncbi:ABC transporter permease [Actinophytocola oryzae]|uniref:ABC-2 type transport system permease protein n=1 Tax=Actinophytocola oryzae TaxID=502181 RepID=A0A4R7VHX8_9PSEU|nr:ABC transporter permease [Actinophytocola oryzae]TDV48688.1 ABC-2 type transport system permease protein [Actinophytocola oryzae]
MRTAVRVVRCSAANAFADLRVIYTWKTWTFGWLGRMLAQVTFFTFLGHLLGDPGATRFLVLGNSLMACVIECLLVIPSSAWERAAGTLGLLAAAPSGVGWVFFGRSLQWPVSGTATSLVSLFALGPLFGVTWSPAQVLPVVAVVVVTAFTTYCLGLVLAAVVLWFGQVRNITSNVAYLTMMVICGVQVPVGYWPGWVGAIAETVPLTHSLRALRGVADGAPFLDVTVHAVLALVAGACWLGASLLAFRVAMYRGRRAGTIDFAS